MCGDRRDVFFAPEMKCVSEDNVTEDAAEIVIAKINRGIELEVRCDVTGKTYRR